MDKELKKDIKLLLFLDDLFSSKGSLSNILDDVEDELEDLFGKGGKSIFDFDRWFISEDKENKE